MSGISNLKGPAAANVVNSPITTGGAQSAGGLLNNQKDAKEASTDAKFGDVWKNIQSKYGAKAEKPREIKKVLGKDDFLRIMVTQMKHQDPTSPFKAEQMATEMAQFTSVEQLQNLNQNFAKMADANKPIERLAMTNLIGKTVTVDRERFPHTEGNPEALAFNLPKDASKAHISLIADTGETVFEKDLGQLKAGENTYAWDGKRTNTLPAKGGTYILKVDAKDEKDQTIQSNPLAQSRVIGISFEGTEPVFLIGDAARPDKVTMRNIVKIEDNGSALVPGAKPFGSAPGAQPQGAPVAAVTPQGGSKGPNLFTFKKGEGSSNLEMENLPPEAREALRQFEQQKAEMAAESAAAAAHEQQAQQGQPMQQGGQPQAQVRQAPSHPDLLAQALAAAGSAGGAQAQNSQSARGQANVSPADRAPAGSADAEKGFPNGLSHGDN